MSNMNNTSAAKTLVDEYNNIHYLAEELARGGQGVVFRTTDADLAIKQPLDASGNPDKNVNLRDRFRNIRLLPLPPGIKISLPLAILRDEPGYVMRLLNEMRPFNVFDLDGKTKKRLEGTSLPQWLEGVPDKDMALQLLHYADTGSTRCRLSALAKCASILARLHSAGLVYGDISGNNAFVGNGASGEVWLIDADNLRLERVTGGASVFTPGYGAPEVVQGKDASRPYSDCWAFAVMAFKILSLSHPFIGKKVLQPETDDTGWDADPVEEAAPIDLDEQAYAGYFPFVDDEDDDSNQAMGGLPRGLILTSQLRLLFQETLGAGRTQPHRRPAMAFWAWELARAFDLSLNCPECKMSYFADAHIKCPYCHTIRPIFARIKTSRWELYTASNTTEISLPHRLFHPFSPELSNNTEYEAVLDWQKRTAQPVRGTKPFPPGLSIEFVEVQE